LIKNKDTQAMPMGLFTPFTFLADASAGSEAASSGITTEIAVVSLLVVASVVAMLVRRIRLPYTIALVLAGLAMGAMRTILPDEVLSLHLTEDLLMAVLLPVLLFEAAFHVNLTAFRANLRTILLLAVPGVAIGIFFAGGAFYYVLPWFDLQLTLLVACLLGATLAATDPVSVIAMFKELGAPKRLALIMEGESLLNDGIAVVAFSALAAAAGIGPEAGHADLAWLVKFFAIEVGGGLLIGLALGAAVSWILSWTDDHLIEITLTTALAYGAYLVAYKLHASGVIAVVAAGMMCGNFGSRHGMSPASRMAVISFWEYAAFAVNSLVFLLIGMEIHLPELVGVMPMALAVFVILTVIRAAVIWSIAPIVARREGAFGEGWRQVLTWGGLRGGISMVLALWLVQQKNFEQGPAIRNLVFAVVLIILLVQGTTLSLLLKKFGLVFACAERERAAGLRTKMKAIKAALTELDRQYSEHIISADVYSALREQYAGRQAEIEEAIEDLAPAGDLLEHEMAKAHAALAVVEKETIRHAFDRGTIPEHAMRQMLNEIDARRHEEHH
jgi:CPA1 family monovalent cation:H+ antiporter